jgi:hypothetical protein
MDLQQPQARSFIDVKPARKNRRTVQCEPVKPLEFKQDFDFRPPREMRDHEKRRFANIAKAQPQQDAPPELAPYRRACRAGPHSCNEWRRAASPDTR